MREILFRGKRVDNGECVISNTFYQCDGKIKLWDEPNRDGYVEVDTETVGQYTGLRDSKRTAEHPKGQMIFEGDIVKGLFRFYRPVNSVVAYSEGSFGLLWDRGGVETFWAFPTICNVEYEVIGNIHDNPELLKGGGEE